MTPTQEGLPALATDDEIAELRAFIDADRLYDPDLATVLRVVVPGLLARLATAERELGEIKAASEDWMEQTGQAYCYVGIRDYAAVKERADSAERQVTELREALNSLTNTADGLSFQEKEIRRVVGNTNWQVLRTHIEAASAALEAKSHDD